MVSTCMQRLLETRDENLRGASPAALHLSDVSAAAVWFTVESCVRAESVHTRAVRYFGIIISHQSPPAKFTCAHECTPTGLPRHVGSRVERNVQRGSYEARRSQLAHISDACNKAVRRAPLSASPGSASGLRKAMRSASRRAASIAPTASRSTTDATGTAPDTAPLARAA